MGEDKRRELAAGLREKVMGKRPSSRNNFNAEFQDLTTRYVWGEVWSRPHFDERTRRILVIGTLIALKQWDEVRLHSTTALREGCLKPDDLKEIIIQQTIYCGVPAGVNAMREISKVLEELKISV